MWPYEVFIKFGAARHDRRFPSFKAISYNVIRKLEHRFLTSHDKIRVLRA